MGSKMDRNESLFRRGKGEFPQRSTHHGVSHEIG
jgi:hypothetical protein